MEPIITSVRVFDKNCIGCTRNKKDVMIAYTHDDTEGIVNIFLTQDQAKTLTDDLIIVTERNEAEIKIEQTSKAESLGDILRSAYPTLKRSDKIEPKDIEGKKINEIIDKNTQICDKFVGNLEIIKMGDTIINLAYKAGTVGNITILCGNNYVFIFDKKKLKAIFYVYDLGHVTINDRRGLITAGGHETAHEYWLDNGEYHKNHVR